jgi:hypothetical protein
MTSAPRYHLAPKSSNVKTGAIPVSTSGKQTCPPVCPLYLAGCYAAQSFLGIHWSKITNGERGEIFADFLITLEKVLKKSTAPIWRHNQAGDLVGLGDDIDLAANMLIADISNRSGVKGFTYTHKPLENSPLAAANLQAVKSLNAAGFVVNASANNLAHADRLAALGVPVCVTIPTDTHETFETPEGRKGIVCPAQTRDNVDCLKCKLCSRSDRSVLIGFRFHGSRAKAAAANAARYTGG